MNMSNNVMILGRLAKDPEVKEANDFKTLKIMSVACQRNYKNKDGNFDVDWIPVRANGKVAELIEKFFHKGDKICASGCIRVDDYTDKEGNKKSITYVLLDTISFDGSSIKRDAAPAKAAPATEEALGSEIEDDDDLPF